MALLIFMMDVSCSINASLKTTHMWVVFSFLDFYKRLYDIL